MLSLKTWMLAMVMTFTLSNTGATLQATLPTVRPLVRPTGLKRAVLRLEGASHKRMDDDNDVPTPPLIVVSNSTSCDVQLALRAVFFLFLLTLKLCLSLIVSLCDRCPLKAMPSMNGTPPAVDFDATNTYVHGLFSLAIIARTFAGEEVCDRWHHLI